MKTLPNNIALLLVTFCCQACFFDKPDKSCAAYKAYGESPEIIEVFSNRSVFRRGDMIILDIYKDQHRNSFYFLENKKHSSLELMTDSLDLRSVVEFDFVKSRDFNADSIKKLVEVYAMRLVSKMRSLNIEELTSQFSHLGIDLQLYFKDESTLIYVSNIERVSNGEWRAFINKAKKIDTHWYYYVRYPSD